MKNHPKISFAGQISGVEGYMESAASGIVAALHLVRKLKGMDAIDFPEFTMIGALSGHIINDTTADFQPMGANFGILPTLDENIRDKQERYLALSNRSAKWFNETFKTEG